MDPNSVEFQQGLEAFPEPSRETLEAYITKGRPPGSFLRCILENDLAGAAMRADFVNQRLLFRYAYFLHNCAPALSWGNKEKVKAWISSGGLEGLAAKHQQEEQANG